jgi:2-alkyl-3-oxoalkanoate reductase
MRVYLTGGSGLLGSHLAERLRARGDEVLCLQRKGSDTSFLEAIGCGIVAGDVRDGAEALHGRMQGCDALVHAAALVYVGGPWPRLRAVNVEGTSHVLRAAAAASVPHAVHVSSVAVYGRSEGPVAEGASLDTPLEPSELYARSKRESESAARAVAHAEAMRLTIVRPAALYGERDRLLTPRLARLVRLPILPLVGGGHNAVPIVYAGNAAHAVELLLDAARGAAASRSPEEAAGRARNERVYNIGIDHRLTQRELLEGMAHALGRSPRFVTVPPAFVREGARLGEALGLNLPGAGDLTLERLARLSVGENPYTTDRLRDELAWAPPFTHAEGLARTADWIRNERTTR